MSEFDSSGNPKTQSVTIDHANVRVPPPVIYLTFLVSGVVMDSPWIGGQLSAPLDMAAGAVVLVVAIILSLYSVPRHRKEGSNVEPWKPTTKIFSDGIYGRSRNPIYLAMALLFAGIALVAGSTMALAYLIPCLLVIRFYVIAREESYLEQKFGAEYLDYKARVRRWI